MATFTILEPMSTGDVIDRAVRIYRRNFSVLIRIVSIPCLIGYIASLMFWFGYSRIFNEVAVTGSTETPGLAILLILAGGVGYLVWVMVLLTTFAGLSRVVGDHVMLDEPITFRKFLSAVRGRLGNIVVMALLLFAIVIGLYILLSMIMLALVMIVGVIVGLTAAAGLPPWAFAVSVGMVVIVSVAGGIIALLFVLARVIFLPQVVMVEGQPPGQAIGRAIKLGSGNWYRVGAIILFAYFVELSLLAALTLPVLAVLYLAGMLDGQFLVGPAWNIFYAAFSQIAYLLTLPIWIVSFTLLYFDSRVRKEAYDIELLAREVSPGFVWQPVVQPAPFGYQMAVMPTPGRQYIQTSPLGLAGYVPNRPPVAAPPAASQVPPYPQGPSQWPPQPPQSPAGAQQPGWAQPPTLPQPQLRAEAPIAPAENGGLEQANQTTTPTPADDTAITPNVTVSAPGWAQFCKTCGDTLIKNAQFCIRCGSKV
jgi:hypothetical protein